MIYTCVVMGRIHKEVIGKWEDPLVNHSVQFRRITWNSQQTGQQKTQVGIQLITDES